MADQTYIRPIRGSVDQNERFVSAPYDGMVVNSERAFHDLLLKEKQKRAAEAKPPKKVYRLPIKFKMLEESDLDVMRAVNESSTGLVEMLRHKMHPGEFAGVVNSAIVLSRIREVHDEYQTKLGAARNDTERQAIENAYKKLMSAAEKYFRLGGLKRIDDKALLRSAQMISKNAAFRKAVQDIEAQCKSVSETSNLPKVLYAEFAATAPASSNLTMPVDGYISSAIDICNFDVTLGYTHHIIIQKPFEYYADLWCPKWNDPFRTCRTLIVTGELNALIALRFEVTISCYHVTVSGTATARACVEDIDIHAVGPLIPQLPPLCGTCWAGVDDVAVTAMLKKSDGCELGLTITGTSACNIPIMPFLAGNFEVNVVAKVPSCPIGIG